MTLTPAIVAKAVSEAPGTADFPILAKKTGRP
jgi:hypothetical protein